MSILVLTSDTLIGTPATGNLEYNGQFFGTDSNASRAQIQRITQGTAVASTSGTSIDFTSIPSWVKRITVMFDAVSLNGSSNLRFQLGDSGGVETTGYVSVFSYNGASNNGSTSSTGFDNTGAGGASLAVSGQIVISLLSASTNTWTVMGMLGAAGSAFTLLTTGSKSLSATLDRVRITTVNGTDTFDAGSINILYEG
jgi:hypothetical protein